MCGIFGVVYADPTRVPDEDKLWESAKSLNHRGPDASGIHAEPGVGFAHTRLSFLDVDPRSNQPLWDATGRYCVVFNGEIYNYKQLRAGLEERGVEFRTTSDTEVLLYALIHGDAREVIPTLEGMFAFGFWDKETRRLVLARDRFGMKPLYVRHDANGLLFASEVKALRPWWNPDLDEFAISSYLLGFGGPTKGFTFYKDVKSLAPGGMIELTGDGPPAWGEFFELTDFWDPAEIDRLRGLSPEATVDRMEQLLVESVEAHMFADVPVGAFCSGGVDSSLLMAMAARSYSDLAIFHANVKGRWSEHHAAAALAKHLKLELNAVDVEEQDFVDMIPDVMVHYEHPFTYHPNCAPLMMVSHLARNSGVKGLLSGEGSDECFLGYPWLGRKRLMDRYHRIGASIRGLVRSIPAVGQLMWPYEGEGHKTVRALLNRREIEDDEARNRAVADAIGRDRISDRDLWTQDYLGHHLRTLLHRNDTMGMSASIEARFPFLDHKVVSMATNMPAKYKLRFSPTVFEKAHPFVRDKWVVRKVADRYVPRGLSQRIKIGFWTTVFQRMNVDPKYFDDSYTRELFGLSTDSMRSVIAQADQDLLMRLLHVDVWGRVCVEQDSTEAATAKLNDHVTIRSE